MKRILLAGAFALTAVTCAFAADLPPPAPPPPRAPAAYIPAPAPVYNWSGLYAGLNGGYGFGTSNWTAFLTSSGNFSPTGWIVGGTLGGNYQIGEFVFGAETDLDFSTIKGNTPAAFCVPCGTANDWLGTFRGRAGFALDRVLFYGTFGFAYGDIKMNAITTSNDSTQLGWAGGAGVEGAFADNWTARLEYLYADLGNATCTTACLGGNFPVSLKLNLVRLGVDYKFAF